MDEEDKVKNLTDEYIEIEESDLDPVVEEYLKSDGKRVYRIIAEVQYCGKIPKGNHVHHINMRKSDDRPTNLITVNEAKHKKYHMIMNGLVGHLMELGIIGFSKKKGYFIIPSNLSQDQLNRRQELLEDKEEFNPLEFIKQNGMTIQNDRSALSFIILDLLNAVFPEEIRALEIAEAIKRSKESVAKELNSLVKKGDVIIREGFKRNEKYFKINPQLAKFMTTVKS